MTTDLKVFLIIGGWTALVAFVAYWKGYRAHQIETHDLEQELDAAIEAITGMAAAAAESKRRHPANAFRVIQGGAS